VGKRQSGRPEHAVKCHTPLPHTVASDDRWQSVEVKGWAGGPTQTDRETTLRKPACTPALSMLALAQVSSQRECNGTPHAGAKAACLFDRRHCGFPPKKIFMALVSALRRGPPIFPYFIHCVCAQRCDRSRTALEAKRLCAGADDGGAHARGPNLPYARRHPPRALSGPDWRRTCRSDLPYRPILSMRHGYSFLGDTGGDGVKSRSRARQWRPREPAASAVRTRVAVGAEMADRRLDADEKLLCTISTETLLVSRIIAAANPMVARDRVLRSCPARL